MDFWGKFRRGVESADAAYLASIANYDQVLVTLLGDVAVTYIGIRTTEAAHRSRPRQCPQAGGFAQDRAGEVSGRQHQRARRLSGDDVFSKRPSRQSPSWRSSWSRGATRSVCCSASRPNRWVDYSQDRAAFRRRRTRSRWAFQRICCADAPTFALPNSPPLPKANRSVSPNRSFIPRSAFPEHSAAPPARPTVTILEQIFKSTGVAYAAGPAFQWNILNYGQITNNVRLQDATLQQLLVDYQNAVLAAQQQVDNGISAFLLSRSQAEDLRRSVVAANGTLKVATEQYDAGATDFTTVLVAEQNLFQYESDFATARANVSLGATSIYRALGGGWQIREDSDFVTAATRDQMRARTNWGDLLSPAEEPQPPAPGLPSPADLGPSVRPPQW